MSIEKTFTWLIVSILPNAAALRIKGMCFIMGLLLVQFFAHAQTQVSSEGKSFTLTFLPNATPSASTQQLILASKTNTSVTISNNFKGYSQVVNLTANVPAITTIPGNMCIQTLNEIVDSFAISVTSPNDISVSQLNLQSATSDGTMILPDNLLSTEYYAATFNGFNQNWPSMIVIVATQDNTVIEITPSVLTLNNHNAGSTFSITMNKGTTYRIDAKSIGTTHGDLSGTHIKVMNGCKPIAVFSGTPLTNVPSNCVAGDHLVEEMIPTLYWGKSFVLAPFAGNNYHPVTNPNALVIFGYRVIAGYANTIVTVNGSNVDTLQPGEYYTYMGANTPTCVKTSQPAQVAQYMEGTSCSNVGDPSITIMPPVEQMVNSVNFSTAVSTAWFNQHYVNVIVKTAAKSTVKLNGSTVNPFYFKSFGSCSDYSYAVLPVSIGTNKLESDSGFIALAYGYGSYNSYAFIGGANFRNLKYDFSTTGNTCGSLNLTFKNTGATSEIASSQWDFGDNTSATGTNVSKSYTAHGYYTIRNIVAYNGSSCNTIDTLIRTIRTLALPQSGFIIDNPVQCTKGNKFEFSDTSLYFNGSKKTTSKWTIADTLIVKDSFSFKQVMPGAGIYKVRLLVQSNDLCIDSTVKYVTVSEQAKPDFISNNTACFNGHAFNPQQNSSIAGSYIKGYYWDFGDGTTDTAASPVKHYSKADSFNVKLVAIAANGCSDTIVKKYTLNVSANAAFSVADKCQKDTVTPVNTSSIASGTIFYTWNFGDGKTDTGAVVTKLYDQAGTYDIKLTVQSNLGCRDSIINPVKIKAQPKADYLITGRCMENSTDFVNKSDTLGTPVASLAWNFGDGNTNTGHHVNHTYQTYGQQTTSMIITLTNGCKDSVSKRTYVNPRPKAAFYVNDSTQCLNGNEFSYFNSSNLAEGHIKRYRWMVNDVFWSNAVSEKKSYAAHGNYDVKLVVESDSSCFDSALKTTYVYPEVYLDVSVNDSVQCQNEQVFTFTNNSSLSGGSISSFLWSFSNGDLSTDFYPAPEIFVRPGKYELTVSASTDKGCTQQKLITMLVNHSPIVDFSVKANCSGDSSFFDNTSTVASGKIGHWLWDFGDGQTSDDFAPFHTYNSGGKYSVKLVGYTDQGCADTISKDSVAVVKAAPFAFFTTEYIDALGQFTSYKFNNKSIDGNRYFWNFGNGNYSREFSPEEMFADTGYFDISLAVQNDNGCYSHYDTLLHIGPELQFFVPNAFTPNKDNKNAVFRIEGVYYVHEFELSIFNRWGQMVFHSTDPDYGWDGTFNDESLADGVYMYTARVVDMDHKLHILKGSLTLMK